MDGRWRLLAPPMVALALLLLGCEQGRPGPTSSISAKPTETFPAPETAAPAEPSPPAQVFSSSPQWQSVSLGIPTYVGVAAVAGAPSDPMVVYLAAYAPPGLFGSADGGATWQAAGQALAGLAPFCLAVDPADADRVWVGTVLGAYETRDGGCDWAPVTDLPQGPIYTLFIAPDGRVLVVGGEATGIWRSGDGGRTWSAADVRDDHPIPDQHIPVPGPCQHHWWRSRRPWQRQGACAFGQNSSGGQHLKDRGLSETRDDPDGFYVTRALATAHRLVTSAGAQLCGWCVRAA